MAENDISTRPANQLIVIHDREIFHYGSTSRNDSNHRVNRVQVSFVLRSSAISNTTLPGSFMEIDTPNDVDPEGCFAIEPKSEHQSWLTPQIVDDAVHGKVRIVKI
jgi:hypothetical protein